MDKFIINGGKRLQGTVNISGAKNAAVAIIPAAILADGPCTLYNVPEINDVSIDLRILTDKSGCDSYSRCGRSLRDGAFNESELLFFKHHA